MSCIKRNKKQTKNLTIYSTVFKFYQTLSWSFAFQKRHSETLNCSVLCDFNLPTWLFQSLQRTLQFKIMHYSSFERDLKSSRSLQSEAALTLLSFCAAVELEYSLDLGLTWQPLVRDCLPTSPDCSSYTLQRLLVADTYNKWGRVTLPIPSYARSARSTFSASDAAVFC